MDFRDETGEAYSRFPVNDLAFRRLAQQLHNDGISLDNVAERLLKLVTRSDRLFLRIGLARPTAVGEYDEACWAQVTGVYTFPDYLNGRIWADFDEN